MKALTFKKSALVAALVLAAGTASATKADLDLVHVDSADNTAPAGAGNAFAVVATQKALVGKGDISTSTTDLLKVKVPASNSIAANSVITFTFTNGGLATGKTYRLVKNVDGVSVGFIDTTLDGVKNTSAGDAVKEISFVINEIVAADGIIYLADEDVVDTTGQGTFKDNAGGLEFKFTKSAAAGAKLTANVAVDNPNVSDDSIYTAKEDLGIALSGFAMNGFGTTAEITTSVDFTEGALLFKGGINSGKTVQESGFGLVPRRYDSSESYKSVATGGDTVFDGTGAAPDITASYQTDVTLSMENCDAVKVSSGGDYDVVLKANNSAITLSKDSAADCTWTGTIADSSDSATVEVTVDGKTKITDNVITLAYQVEDKNEGNKLVDSGSTKVSIWSTDVIATGSALKFPLLTAANGNASAFSLVKVDNSEISSSTDILISGTVEQIEFVDGEKKSTFISFDNYKLNTSIAANSLGQFSGDDIIDSLLTPVGSDEFGYETTAVEGLKKEAIHHISVKLQVSAAETKNGSFGKVVAYNSTRTGRIGVTSQTN